MQKTTLLLTGLGILFLGFFSYSVFLAEDALVNRTEVIKDGNGGYEVVTTRTDGSKIIETYVVNADGSPFSHTLATQGSEPGSEIKAIKQGTFVPKHN